MSPFKDRFHRAGFEFDVFLIYLGFCMAASTGVAFYGWAKMGWPNCQPFADLLLLITSPFVAAMGVARCDRPDAKDAKSEPVLS